MKLSKRLRKIDQMVATSYQHIWDCCCDHGLLGMTLLARNAAPNVHFVDIVPELMQQLNTKLTRFFPHSTNAWATHCLDVKTLPLAQYSQNDSAQHLVIIAGVGGDLMTELIEGICANNPTITIDFLLCPVHHQYSLRAKLIALKFSLLDEVLLEENKRFYELLLVSNKASQGVNISAIGDKIWQANSTEQALMVERYLSKTISHYQRIQLGQNVNVRAIIDAYQKAPLKLPSM